jgi:hypothetical protein
MLELFSIAVDFYRQPAPYFYTQYSVFFLFKTLFLEVGVLVFFLFVAPARGFRLFVPRSSEEGVVDHGRVLFASSLESNCGVNLFAVFALVFFLKKTVLLV